MRFSAFAFASAALATLASAYTTPKGDAPEGNPITKPGLNELVPAGTQYEITWNPTTDGTVSLVLLRGPSTDVVPMYAIAEKIDNSGKFYWTPKDDLQPDTTHYGLEIIDDATGQYQYSTQFGISNKQYSGSSSSSSSAAASSAAPSSTQAPTGAASATNTFVTSSTGTAAPFTSSTGYPLANSTSSYGAQSTFKTMPSASATGAKNGTALPTGAAGRMAMNFGGVVLGAGAAIAMAL
ncbi:hypothetical protein L228DRAFT_237402 [Xylona heveae TC161]|uniref:Yeast cell wall synthesis Kre9/Knh1-like N-terminal domain-containing protein n=1 Tax=Xylona heveae (strain CBS 132557 / TC161) TaxID=1328760 RepID=A0A161TEU4_XYLHT|nr:hypothetical protein L228DRAFT_237402 [Xylona heveae TC161]KZF24477.1 hypothetical protein L228DRAFT_237402 [Xylona heveae TC161]